MHAGHERQDFHIRPTTNSKTLSCSMPHHAVVRISHIHLPIKLARAWLESSGRSYSHTTTIPPPSARFRLCPFQSSGLLRAISSSLCPFVSVICPPQFNQPSMVGISDASSTVHSQPHVPTIDSSLRDMSDSKAPSKHPPILK